MSLKFNINRPKVSDEEIKKNQDFNQLVEQFKKQSLKKARGDESWWKNKRVRYATIIAGITVVCTITYQSLKNNKTTKATNETLTTTKKEQTTKNPATKFINEPSQKLKIAYSSFKVNNQQGASLTHSTSSKIKIPKNSFVDKNGKEIVGDVTIEYREFHDMGDVIVSGIPMEYDSAGIKRNLESAGMFDIRGSQNGEAVFIKKDKKLEVQLASLKNENRFNQYYLDTNARNWQYIKHDESLILKKAEQKKTSKKTEILTLAETAKLKRIEHIAEVVIPKRIDSVKTVCNAKVEKLPAPKMPTKPAKASGRPTFKLDGDNDEFPELAAFNNLIFEIGSENKNYTPEIHEITWSDVKMSRGPNKEKNYWLTLTYRNRVEKLIVYPVLTGADYEKAQEKYSQKLEAYEQLLQKRENEEKRLIAEMEAKQAAYLAEQKRKREELESERAKLATKYNLDQQRELASVFNDNSLQAKATRVFNVSQFGIYNSDCPHGFPTGTKVSPLFALDEKQKPIHPDLVYLVDYEAQSVFALDKQQGLLLSYDKNKTYSMCVFAKNKMYVCNKASFKESADAQNKKFLVTALPEHLDNLPGFKKFLEL